MARRDSYTRDVFDLLVSLVQEGDELMHSWVCDLWPYRLDSQERGRVSGALSALVYYGLLERVAPTPDGKAKPYKQIYRVTALFVPKYRPTRGGRPLGLVYKPRRTKKSRRLPEGSEDKQAAAVATRKQ